MRPLVVCSLILGSALLAAPPAAFAEKPAAGSHGGRPTDPKDAEIARLRGALERALGQRATEARDRSVGRHGVAARGGHDTGHAAAVDTSPEAVWQSLLEGNRRFVLGRPRTRELVGTRKRLVEGQHPRAIVLTCSDSRVGPEILFDQTLGEIFVVRTAGNIADAVALGSIEYAVEHLHARLVVVLGHESCGAIAAAASGQDPGSPNLRAIVSKIRPAIAKLDVCGSGPLGSRLKVEANVGQSARDLIAQSTLLRDALVKGEIAVVQAVYELSQGEVVPLDQPLYSTEPMTPAEASATRHPQHF